MSEIHYACRSLLQKAVRRGQVELVERTGWHLVECQDQSWLAARTGVILAEECWPLLAGYDARAEPAIHVELLTRAAASCKRREAAGLGSLGLALHQSQDCPALPEVVNIAAAIADPETFWRGAQANAGEQMRQRVVAGALRAWRRASWPWDKAFCLAAGMLAASETLELDTGGEPIELPLWVALDKHTGEGKRALLSAARAGGCGDEQATRASFYLEGARCNRQRPSPWWDLHRDAQLQAVHLDELTAGELWRRMRPLVIARLEPAVAELTDHVANFPEPPGRPFSEQMSLL